MTQNDADALALGWRWRPQGGPSHLEAAARLGYITETLYENGQLDHLPAHMLALVEKYLALMNPTKKFRETS